MKVTHIALAASALAGFFSLAASGAIATDLTPAGVTIRPISGLGAAPDQYALHNETIGTKQTVSYFQNEGGLCNLTVMVGEAFNGEDVPQVASVRFDTTVNPGHNVLFATAEGKSLEFSCQEGAGSMRVRARDEVATYSPAM